MARKSNDQTENFVKLTAKQITEGWAHYKAAWRIFKEVYGQEPEKGSDSRKALASMRHALRYKRAYPNQDENRKNVIAFVKSEAQTNPVAKAILHEETANSKTKAANRQAKGNKAANVVAKAATIKAPKARKARVTKAVKAQHARIAELEAELEALRS